MERRHSVAWSCDQVCGRLESAASAGRRFDAKSDEVSDCWAVWARWHERCNHGSVGADHRRQIGWEQISWNKVGIALSATIILVSGLVLSYRLRDLDWRAVATAVAAVPLAQVAAAAFFVACGYVTLALYDWFALAHHRGPPGAVAGRRARRRHQLRDRARPRRDGARLGGDPFPDLFAHGDWASSISRKYASSPA